MSVGTQTDMYVTSPPCNSAVVNFLEEGDPRLPTHDGIPNLMGFSWPLAEPDHPTPSSTAPPCVYSLFTAPPMERGLRLRSPQTPSPLHFTISSHSAARVITSGPSATDLTTAGPSAACVATSGPSAIHLPTPPGPSATHVITSGPSATRITNSGPSAARVTITGPNAACVVTSGPCARAVIASRARLHCTVAMPADLQQLRETFPLSYAA